ncbi:MAG: universal stress protein [Pseudomonadota bacterium]
MTTSTIIALTDFSPAGDACLERAAHIASNRRWQLRIMYAAEKGNSVEPGPLARLGLSSRQLARRYNLPVEAASQVVVSEAQLVDAAVAAQLVVTGAASHGRRAWFWRDTLIEQLMRNCLCPVLVVRNAQNEPYRKILVGVDFSARSRELVDRACAMSGEAELHLFHAIGRSDEAKLRSSDASAEAINAYRRQVSACAEERLLRLADSLDTRRNRVMFFAGHGDPAFQISVQQDAISADLIVVGKQRQSAFGELFFGSVARRLVQIANSDILIVPQPAGRF